MGRACPPRRQICSPVFSFEMELVMTAIRCIGALVALLVVSAVPVQSQQRTAAGRVKVASGEAFIVRSARSLPAKVGEAVYEADSLRTGTDGRIGVTMKDDTRVSLGPSSEVRLN